MAKSNNQMEFTTVKIKGVVDFASVHEPKAKYKKENSKFANDKEYSITLRLDDKDTLAAFKHIMSAHNISETVMHPGTGQHIPRLRENKDGMLVVQFKRNFISSKGKEIHLTVVDVNDNPIPKEELIGNGSLVLLRLNLGKNLISGETTSILLDGVQVIDRKVPTGGKFGKYEDDSAVNREDVLNTEGPF